MTRKSPHAKTTPHGKRALSPRAAASAAAAARVAKGQEKPPEKNAAGPVRDADRIAKVIARAGLASRREAEQWIAAGRVAVNGAAITSPALNVTGADRITIDGKTLPERERTRLFLFHKPRDLVTTHADPQDRPTIFSVLPSNLPRLISVGRLDINTEGLLLLTNDGGLARVLELPQTAWLRRYRVRAHGRVLQPALDALRGGITIDGVNYGPIEATIDREQGANVWITFAIREGKNREVRNVLRHLDLHVNRLIRVSYGPFQLGELAEGAIEEIKTRVLREQLGPRIVADAHADFSAPIIIRDEVKARAPHTPTGAATPRAGAHPVPATPASAARKPMKRPVEKDRFAQRSDAKARPAGGRAAGGRAASEASAKHAAAAHPSSRHPSSKRPASKHLASKNPASKNPASKNPSAKRSRQSLVERFGGPELARRERKGYGRKDAARKGGGAGAPRGKRKD